jgi:hemerythrin-like domain-containing protein
MDYLTRAKYDHGALRMMLDIQKEILARLAKARGVNLLHLEEILRFWEEFFCREHLTAEEEFLFDTLRRLEHPALAELVAEHEELCLSIEKLKTIAGRLRAGKPNSGREFLETGNGFGLFLERHLNKENSIFTELTIKEYEGAGLPRLLSPETFSKLTRLFSLLNNLAGEYLGKEYDTTWLQLEKRKEPAVNRDEAAETREPAETEEAREVTETVEVSEAPEETETAEMSIMDGDETPATGHEGAVGEER